MSVGTEGVFDAVFWSAVTQKHRLCRERWPVLLATFFFRSEPNATRCCSNLTPPSSFLRVLLFLLRLVIIFFSFFPSSRVSVESSASIKIRFLHRGPGRSSSSSMVSRVERKVTQVKAKAVNLCDTRTGSLVQIHVIHFSLAHERG